MDITFTGKRVLVTGAGQGIGRGLAEALGKAKALVTAISKGGENLDALKKNYPTIKTIHIDVTSEKIRQVVRENGPYDCLVNNAGVAILEPFLTAKESSFDQTFNVNIKAIFNISQVVAQQMVENNIKGSIVNLSSQASKVVLRDHAMYCSSKGAVDMMTKVMALELGQYGIRVNCVNPTVVLTAMSKPNWDNPEKGGPLKSRIPLNRFAEVDDVVNAVLFLLSDKSEMINAHTLPVDGGFWAT